MNKQIYFTIIFIAILMFTGCFFHNLGFSVNNSSYTSEHNIIKDDNTLNNISVKELILYNDYTYIVDQNGLVYSWYKERDYQHSLILGHDGEITTIKEALKQQVNIPEPIDNILITESAYHTKIYAKTVNNNFYEFGRNRKEYGNFDPIKVDIEEPIKQFFLFDEHKIHSPIYNYAITKNGSLYAWGSNNEGQLGIGNYNYTSTPTKINSIEEQFKELFSVRFYNSDDKSVYISNYAIAKNGSLYAWGNNEKGQLKLGDYKNRISPAPVDFPEHILKFKILQKSGSFSDIVYAITKEGNLYTGWYGDKAPKKIDIQEKVKDIVFFDGFQFYKDNVVYAITENGLLYTWHHNKKEQFDNVYQPKKLDIDEPVKEIIINNDSMYTITKNGSLYTWGNNDKGQLIVNINKQYVDTPTKVEINGQVNNIYFAKDHNLIYILANDGSLYAWGYNNDGQLGIGNFTSQNTLVKVKIDESISEILINNGSIYALTNTGLVYAWGLNNKGQLGLNHYEDTHTPTKINIKEPVKKLLCNPSGQLYALTNNGLLYLWGLKTSILLGLDKYENKDVIKPTLITF